MEHLNYSKMSIIGLTMITLIGVFLIVSYFFKYLKYNREASFQIIDNSADKNITLLSTENALPLSSSTADKTVTKVISTNTNPLLWGAYVGDGPNDLSNFENLVGKKTNLYADFEGWTNNFPLWLQPEVGQSGKTLIIFWEPDFGYDKIIDGSQDDYIKQFALDAKKYSYPVILVPFVEMNLNEEAWGYGHNNNTAEKFKVAWKRVYDLFKDVPNVKFGLAYNSSSIPNVEGNLYSDYYPGDNYVDYIGVDGFSFNNSWQTFGDIFDKPIKELNSYNKPIILFSLGAEDNSQKASWITEGLGSHLKNYKNVIGWVWFNKGGEDNWIVNSNEASLNAFRSILP